MSDENQAELNYTNAKRPNKFLRLILAFLFLIIISFVIWRIFYYKSPQEQLAAIEKSRAIPDSENAAIIYNQLFENYTDSYLKPAFLTPTIDDITRSSPWKSQEYPEVAEWLEENKDIFTKLLQVSKYKNCLFPIALSSSKDMNITERLTIVRQLTFWLIRSANKDFGEGRTDEAMKKYISCIHMGRHFSQQPVAVEFLVGIGIEAIGQKGIRNIIMHEDATAEQLKTIETILPDKKFQLDEYWALMLHVENLYSKILPKTSTSTNLLSRLKELWQNRNNEKTTMQRVKELYSRLLADRQGTQILVTLKNYKIQTGQWPEKLDEIKPYLSSEDILIDPQNKGSFVYKLKDDGFILYSTGLNGIDDNGKYSPRPADDWPIWPTQTSQVQSQNTSTKLSDPNME